MAIVQRSIRHGPAVPLAIRPPLATAPPRCACGTALSDGKCPCGCVRVPRMDGARGVLAVIGDEMIVSPTLARVLEINELTLDMIAGRVDGSA